MCGAAQPPPQLQRGMALPLPRQWHGLHDPFLCHAPGGRVPSCGLPERRVGWPWDSIWHRAIPRVFRFAQGRGAPAR